jgi:hypothetical protein
MRERKMENHPDAAATQDANKIGVKKERVYGGEREGEFTKEEGEGMVARRCSVLGARWVAWVV